MPAFHALLRRCAEAVRRLHARHLSILPLTVELEEAGGTWREVLRGNLHQSQLALLLADQQRLFPGSTLRVRDQRNGEVLASN